MALASLYSLSKPTGGSLPVSRFATALVNTCKYLLPSNGRRGQAVIAVQITASIFIFQLMITPTHDTFSSDLSKLMKFSHIYFSVCAIHTSVPAIKKAGGRND